MFTTTVLNVGQGFWLKCSSFPNEAAFLTQQFNSLLVKDKGELHPALLQNFFVEYLSYQ